MSRTFESVTYLYMSRSKFPYGSKIKVNLRSTDNDKFYGIILTILCEKSLLQSILVLWSVLTKLQSYKVLNSVWVTFYPQMYKTFHLYFLGIYLLVLQKKNFYTVLLSFWRFLITLWNCKVSMIKLCFDVSDIIHAIEHT